ncbi:hypothetical protein D9O40_07865 [Clostridium autoethanogenum]|uniref:Uncharacterized protein n=1 Tax=Clostridium autoethanogenum TaxID=84023 RepID=A0A3M0STI6_9CLOT|nr:hypothetical protein D9O40_07865 [Clostridium autoethanogenum]
MSRLLYKKIFYNTINILPFFCNLSSIVIVVIVPNSSQTTLVELCLPSKLLINSCSFIIKLYNEFRKQHNIVSLKKIIEIPQKYNIGKRPLSLLLGYSNILQKSISHFYAFLH